MRLSFSRFLRYSASITALVAILLGCASTGPTTPNIPFVGKTYPVILNELAQKNNLLAQELGKLPELQDGISPTEAAALETIVELYKDAPTTFNKAFIQMYQVGLPRVRKYCSPLQALFWVSEAGKLRNNKDLLVNYSLEKLLDKAWLFDLPITMSDEQISTIINEIRDEHERKQYLANMQSIDIPKLQKFILLDYKSYPEIFSKKARKIIKQTMELRKNPRWQHFDIVVDRLNAPELIDYYERKRIRYVDWRTLPTPSVSPHYVFRHNKGECVSITHFTIHCLNRSGYNAWQQDVAPYRPQSMFHAVCVFEMNGEKYVMDNGRPDGAGIASYEIFYTKEKDRAHSIN